MLRILRKADKGFVIFTLSGRIANENLEELQKLFREELVERRLVLDLKEVKLVDRDSIKFLARYENNGVRLDNCPAFIREWIMKEGEPKQS